MRQLPLISVFALVLALSGCDASTGQRILRYPVSATGEPPGTFDVAGWQVTLSAAEVGFGPAYFCATAAASSDLCPTAVSEFPQAAKIDGLNPERQLLGDANGETGTVRSATYDFAYTWFPTQRQPTAASAAPRGHSAYFEGVATDGARTLRFVAAVDIVPQIQGARAVQGASVEAILDGPELELEIAASPRTWFQRVDFAELALGTENPVRILPGSRAYEALVLAMTANSRPSLTWTQRE